jgi:hypothetical protein
LILTFVIQSNSFIIPILLKSRQGLSVTNLPAFFIFALCKVWIIAGLIVKILPFNLGGDKAEANDIGFCIWEVDGAARAPAILRFGVKATATHHAERP